MKDLDLEDLIKIAKAGFPDRVKQFINFDELDIIKWGDVFRLFERKYGQEGRLPSESVLTIYFNPEEDFVQFSVLNNQSFNHLAAIRKMQELGKIE